VGVQFSPPGIIVFHHRTTRQQRFGEQQGLGLEIGPASTGGSRGGPGQVGEAGSGEWQPATRPWSRRGKSRSWPPGRCRRHGSKHWPCSRSAEGLWVVAGRGRDGRPAVDQGAEQRAVSGPRPRRQVARIRWGGSWFCHLVPVTPIKASFCLGFLPERGRQPSGPGASGPSSTSTGIARLGGLAPPPLPPESPAAHGTGLPGPWPEAAPRPGRRARPR